MKIKRHLNLSVHKVLLEKATLNHFHVICGSLRVTLVGLEAARETVWLSKPEILTVWFFREQGCQVCARDSSSLGVFELRPVETC